jgi:hypothetical protein
MKTAIKNGFKPMDKRITELPERTAASIHEIIEKLRKEFRLPKPPSPPFDPDTSVAA